MEKNGNNKQYEKDLKRTGRCAESSFDDLRKTTTIAAQLKN